MRWVRAGEQRAEELGAEELGALDTQELRSSGSSSRRPDSHSSPSGARGARGATGARGEGLGVIMGLNWVGGRGRWGAGGLKELGVGVVLVLLCLVELEAADFSETMGGAIGTEPQRCEEDQMWCSRCENTTELWMSGTADPTWITFSQIFNDSARVISPSDGQPITEVDGATFPGNAYHYFEFIVQGGDGLSAEDVRRDSVFFSLLSPERLQVSRGQVVATSVDAAKRPAYDFYVGQNCIPREGSWNNQGYGNINANEKLKSIHVNVTRDGRYFIALQSRKIRYNVAAFDFTMKLSRGSLQSRFQETRCLPLSYRYPDEVQRMIDEFKNTKIIGQALGGPVPLCGATPPEKKYNIKYVYPAPAGGLSQREIAIVVGAVGSGIVTFAIVAGVYLWVRYKRTTQRMAKFSSLSRGLPDALLDGEGQEVAV